MCSTAGNEFEFGDEEEENYFGRRNCRKNQYRSPITRRCRERYSRPCLYPSQYRQRKTLRCVKKKISVKALRELALANGIPITKLNKDGTRSRSKFYSEGYLKTLLTKGGVSYTGLPLKYTGGSTGPVVGVPIDPVVGVPVEEPVEWSDFQSAQSAPYDDAPLIDFNNFGRRPGYLMRHPMLFGEDLYRDRLTRMRRKMRRRGEKLYRRQPMKGMLDKVAQQNMKKANEAMKKAAYSQKIATEKRIAAKKDAAKKAKDKAKEKDKGKEKEPPKKKDDPPKKKKGK